MIIEAGGKKSLRKKEHASSAQSNLIWRRMCFQRCRMQTKKEYSSKTKARGQAVEFRRKTNRNCRFCVATASHPSILLMSLSHLIPLVATTCHQSFSEAWFLGGASNHNSDFTRTADFQMWCTRAMKI